MSPDARLRSLERAAASGDVEAQARQLAERVRAGTLTRERLELAAYVGHTAAREALGGSGLVVTGKDGEGRPVDFFEAGPSVHRVHFWPWVEGLERWRMLHAPVMAAVAAARLEDHEGRRPHESATRIREQPCERYRPCPTVPAYCWCGWIDTKHAGAPAEEPR